ncbi:hypothetical protein GDO78_013279 [Eleutherodactylus coqui]|uniref:receptor protein-tyrosine kinase n=1 Tax=Eleutherodactylus coqui TaxID=57060 RepID=A0A8J6F0H4_ELECQ|nr:hypothetical protein GDO78_013279 [Eleutherodactylus coqui]
MGLRLVIFRMGLLSEVLVLLVTLGAVLAQNDIHFTMEPSNITSSIGKDIVLRCTVKGIGDAETPDVEWLRDNEPLAYADINQIQMPEDENTWLVISELSIHSLQLSDSGWYQCAVEGEKEKILSESAFLQLEGLPIFTDEPKDMHVYSNEHFNLSCDAHGPPGPVLVIWLQDGYPLNSLIDELALTPSLLQATLPHNHLSTAPHHKIYNQNINVPPYTHLISDLTPYSVYNVRVACLNSEGVSHWTDWVPMATMEGVPSGPPENVTAIMNETVIIILWREPRAPLNGVLKGYKVSYQTKDQPELVVDVGLTNDMTRRSADNLTIRVSSYTVSGDGPWSDPIIATFTNYAVTASPLFSWHWWYVMLVVAVAVFGAIVGAIFLARVRKKETQYGEAFEPTVEQGELVVRYRVRKSYSRRTTEATLNRLGISDDLKEKLRDVMVDRHKLTLGKTLGEGEFGSVMEGQLNQDDYILKVAVKTMKIAICTRTEMEDFLSEAVCMKEFDHPNVMRLIGVCLQNTENEGYPSPVVILPFMKHGDLHSFLLYSRLGDAPLYLPTQMLVKFMTDIASGMEYLSSKNFIHRDLAARNCMLNENMNVCVADFGLSKKIYNGDYYRQGRIAKMPVKWIAIESLADRVYTTKSDVWSFGVSMWEIATRGQTPYPGVENSEIYDYLRQGNRLKQPPDCLDGLYELMASCWQLNSKDRPSFETLHRELEKILKNLPPAKDPEEILYVNMEEPLSSSFNDDGELGAVGGLDAKDLGDDLFLKATSVTAEVHQPENTNRYVMCPSHEATRLLTNVSTEHPPYSSTIEEGTLEELLAGQGSR